MSVPRKSVTPEAAAMARHLYEQTNVPLRDIAVLLGIGVTTLVQRAKRWQWTPRSQRVPTAPPPATSLAPAPPAGGGEAQGEGTAGKGATALSRSVLIGRLIHRIEAEIAAIERLIGRGVGAAVTPEASPADAERAARTLAVLVRALRELAVLEKQAPDGDEDEASRDADAFRRELGATLERVLAGGEAA